LSVLKSATAVGDNSYVLGMGDRRILISPENNRKSYKKKKAISTGDNSFFSA
jgi:hypothetical protein